MPPVHQAMQRKPSHRLTPLQQTSHTSGFDFCLWVISVWISSCGSMYYGDITPRLALAVLVAVLLRPSRVIVVKRGPRPTLLPFVPVSAVYAEIWAQSPAALRWRDADGLRADWLTLPPFLLRTGLRLSVSRFAHSAFTWLKYGAPTEGVKAKEIKSSPVPKCVLSASAKLGATVSP
jgi:hypothetical protein